MATPRAAVARPPALGRLAGHYLPDLVYGANDGIITTFAVVSGVVGAALSERVIVILGFANLVADGFSMGASNYLARRSQLERGTRRPPGCRCATASRPSSASSSRACFRSSPTSCRSSRTSGFPSRSLSPVRRSSPSAQPVRSSRKRGLLLSGLEMLLVGSLAAVVAFGIGALAAAFA